MHGLEAVAHIGQGARDDHAHGVIEISPSHLVVDVNFADGSDVWIWHGNGQFWIANCELRIGSPRVEVDSIPQSEIRNSQWLVGFAHHDSFPGGEVIVVVEATPQFHDLVSNDGGLLEFELAGGLLHLLL